MKVRVIFLALLLGVLAIFLFYNRNPASLIRPVNNSTDEPGQDNIGGPLEITHPLSIESLRKGSYPGSEIIIEQKLEPGSNYQRYIASYKSEGLKIYALLTVPNGDSPTGGWPVIIFNHGYIPPSEYRTTERYVAYTDAFSRNGYILFRPDYRGHGNSEGQAARGYGSNAYTIDVLNAVSSIKKLKLPSVVSGQPALPRGRLSVVAASRIGMWGHSLGGHITLKNMVVSKDIKAGVIWAGVVASYPDLLTRWRRATPPASLPTGARRWRQTLIEQYGTLEKNPAFWNSISANSFLSDISGPLQLHHGTADTSVPVEFPQKLYEELKSAGKEAELFTYPGDDHNLANNFGTAIERSVEFFDKYLK